MEKYLVRFGCSQLLQIAPSKFKSANSPNYSFIDFQGFFWYPATMLNARVVSSHFSGSMTLGIKGSPTRIRSHIVNDYLTL